MFPKALSGLKDERVTEAYGIKLILSKECSISSSWFFWQGADQACTTFSVADLELMMMMMQQSRQENNICSHNLCTSLTGKYWVPLPSLFHGKSLNKENNKHKWKLNSIFTPSIATLQFELLWIVKEMCTTCRLVFWFRRSQLDALKTFLLNQKAPSVLTFG